MSWTVVMVAGVLLGQVPASAPGQPATDSGAYWGGIAPVAEMPGATAGAASQTEPAPAPALGGGYLPGSASGGSPQAAPSKYRAQPGTPAAAAESPKTGAAVDPMSNFGNPLQRIMSITDPKNLGRTGEKGAAGVGKPAASGAASEGWAPSGTAVPAQGASPQAPLSGTAGSAARTTATAKPTVVELLKEAASLPAGAGVKGRRVSLLDVLGGVSQRSKRQEIAHAYWRLVQAVGEYRFCWEQVEQFQSVRVGVVDSSLLQSSQEASRSALLAAELALVQAQHYLAEAAGLDSSAELPLPSDRPHIGTYTTNFEQIFADRTPPPGARLIHRTLPLQFQAIGVRVEAIHATQEALQAIGAAYLAGQVDAGELFAAIRSVTDQKRAWLASVCQYNHAIADYAFAVVGSETIGRELVSVLIKVSDAAPKQPKSGDGAIFLGVPRGVEQADYEAPAAAAPAAPAPLAVAPPAVAPPAPAPPASAASERPTLAPPREQLTEAPPSPWTSAPADPTKGSSPAAAAPPAEKNPASGSGQPAPPPAVSPALHEEPVEAPALGSPPPDRASSIQRAPLVSVEAADLPAGERTVFMPPTPAAGAPGRQYQSLDGLDGAVQAKRLALQLHTAGELGLDAKPVDLEACLKGLSTRQRQPALETYWAASMRLAEYRVYRQRIGLLDDLVQVVTLGAASTPAAIVRLKAARLAADADLLEAEVRLTAAQFDLTQRAARPLEGPWLLPTTPPHAGPYQMRLELQDRRLAESWAMRRLAATIPALSEDLGRRARSIVESDRRRVETTAAYRSRELPFVRVLDAVEQQSGETLEFLGALLAYNQSIAEYAMAVVPPAIPEEKLVATLVLVR